MTIEFADPGITPVPLLITGGIVAFFLLIVLAGVIAYFARSTKDADGPYVTMSIGGIGAFAAALIGMLCVGLPMTLGGYETAKDRLIYEEMEKLGFEQIVLEEGEWGETKDGVDYVFRPVYALYNGEEFTGELRDLNYPQDYTYSITETKDK